MSSPTVSEEQLGEIMQDVWNIATYRMFPLLMESMLYALYTALMVFYCLRYYTRDTLRVRGVFAISAILYVLCTSAWALDVVVLWVEMYRLLPGRLAPVTSSLSVRNALAGLVGGIQVARDVCEVIIVLLSDVISLWRAYVIYGRPKWLQVICIAFLSLSTALYIVNEITASGFFLANSPPDFSLRYLEVGGGRLYTAMTALSVSLTACAQILATVLIAWKAWIHRKEIKDLLPDRLDSSNHQRVVAVLYIVIEVGILYTFVWVWFALGNQSVLGPTGYHWANALMIQISGIYPTLIVIVISVRESLLERSVQSVSGLVTIPIHFTSVVSSTDNETPEVLHTPEGSEALRSMAQLDEKPEDGDRLSA